MRHPSRLARRALIPLAVALAFFAIRPPAGAAELIVNGNFEQGQDPGSFATLHAGDPSITGWTIAGVSIDYIGTHWRGADGGRSVDLDGTPGPGAIVQNIPTRMGAVYAFTFRLSANDSCAPIVKRMQAIAGVTARSFAVDTRRISVSKRTWLRESFTFRANAALTRITLRSLDAPTNCGAVVDDVSVTGPRGLLAVSQPGQTPPAVPPSGTTGVGTSGAVPCYVNSGALAALARPCFGPPSSIITVIEEKPVPPGLMLMFTANLTFSTAGAVSTPLSAFSGGIATATAPAALCTGSFPHKWNVWLVDAAGMPRGVIGDYTMNGCP
jgi:choice-of-anchor C domain-containing protein